MLLNIDGILPASTDAWERYLQWKQSQYAKMTPLRKRVTIKVEFL